MITSRLRSRLMRNYPSKEALSARNIALLALTFLYAVLWVGGISSYFFYGGPRDARWAAPSFLFCAGLILVLTEGRNELPVMLAVAVAGFAAEVIGSRYGLIFGEYVYTDTLAPRLLGVPVAMASAWLILVVYVKQMLSPFGLPGWAEITLAALWMTAIDLVIDPLAAGPLDYWRWKEAGAYYGIPAHNFIGWIAVSLLIFLLVRVLAGQRRQPNRRAPLLGFSVVLFFTMIALAVGFYLAAGVGAALCAIHVLVSVGLSKNKNRR